MKILLVEDEKIISDLVIKYLNKEGYHSELASNGFEALEMFANDTYHLILLDIMMPGINGFQVLSHIRETSEVPVIILTARQEEVDRLRGFDYGADDYVIKPFSPRELMSRIKVLMKRVYHQHNEMVITIGEISIYPQSMKVLKSDTKLDLTTTEFKLLHTFMKKKAKY